MKKYIPVALLLCAAIANSLQCAEHRPVPRTHSATLLYPANVDMLLQKLSYFLENEDSDTFTELFSQVLSLAKHNQPATDSKITPQECIGLAFYLESTEENTLPLRAIGKSLRDWINKSESFNHNTPQYVYIQNLKPLLKPTTALAKMGGQGEFPSKCSIL